jgi:hypothetical protein
MAERPSSPRLLGPVLICSSLLFATAAAPTPAPPPVPKPVVTPATIEQQPVVLIYPFEVQTGADPRIGAAIAQIFAQEMTAAGGITAPPVPQGVKRADFLTYARSGHADFYISGYVTPVGDSAAVVEQVVSVDSGVILFSQTAEVSNVADVASQSLQARTQILEFVGRGTQSVQTQPSATPAPTSTNGAAVPISGLGSIVNSVFKHNKSVARGATPAPSAKPDRGVIVAPISASGTVAPGDLASAVRELYFALDSRFNAQMTPIDSNVAQSANTICGTNRDNTIATGTLTHRGKEVTFTLLVYTCFGAILERQVGKGVTIKSAVDAAVTAYANAHPENS